MFRTNYMGNIPGTRQRSESKVGGKDTKIFESGGASVIPWKNWRPKMHIKVILNGYRQAGNENSKEKNPEVKDFVRPGRTEEKQRDPKRVVSLYNSLASSGYFKTHAYDIIASKFSEKRKERDLQKTEEFKKKYEERRKAIEREKANYNSSSAKSVPLFRAKMQRHQSR